MKNLLFIALAIILLHGCATESSSGNSTSDLITGNDPPTTIIDNSDNETGTVTESVSIDFTLKTSNALYFANAEENTLTLWKTDDTINRAGSMQFSVSSDLIQLDSSGDIVTTETLDATADVIRTTNQGVFYCNTIDPATAYAAGALYRTYSAIYKDSEIFSEWYNNEFECGSILEIESDIYIKDTGGYLHQLAGVYDNIQHVQDEAFVIHSLDTVNKRISFNSSVESYTTNNILAAEAWQLYDGLYYSENGYTWSESAGLTENATALSDFQSYPYPVSPSLPYANAPVLMIAGQYDDGLYWIECNSGWLFRYEPGTDTLTQEWRLYTGDGLHSTGINMQQVLNPYIDADTLYFSNDGVVYSLGLDSGSINIFYAGDGEVLAYD